MMSDGIDSKRAPYKILLINPYLTAMDPTIRLSEPMGLLCLATWLKHTLGDAVDVQFLDLFALGADNPTKRGDLYVIGKCDEQSIRAEIQRLDPDLVGVTCNFTVYADDALEVAAIAKRACPKVRIIIGGAHATIEAESILATSPAVDYVAQGEGEKTLEDLVLALMNNKPVEGVEGISLRDASGTPYSTPPRELIKDMDEIPIPDRHYIDAEAYKRFSSSCIWHAKKRPIAAIMTSRGCPFHCVFCSTSVVWRRKWRPRSVSSVIQEVEYLRNTYGIREITINDDQLLMRKDRMHALCDAIIERNLGMTFAYEAGVSTWLVDEALLLKMKKAGFYSLKFAIESGCPETLKFIGKPIDLKKALEIIAFSNKLGFWTMGNFLLGFPDETLEQVQQTIDFAYSSGLDYAVFHIVKAHAGSELYEYMRREGLLEQAVVRGSNFYRCDFGTRHLSASQLEALYLKASSGWFPHKLSYYLTPSKFRDVVMPKFKSLDDFRYAGALAWRLVGKKILPLLKRNLGLGRTPAH